MPRPVRLLLTRHAEPEHHVLGLTGGSTDLALTPRGRRQAASLAHALRSVRPTAPCRLLSSDLKRATETAHIVATALGGVEVASHGALREPDNGVAAYRSVDEARALMRPRTDPVLDWIPYEGGESWRQMGRRVVHFLDDLAARTNDRTWLVVTHSNAMAAITHWWLGLDEAYWDRITYVFDRASLTVLATNVLGEVVIERLNDTTHLASPP